VVKDLVRIGISAEAIHGNKSQNARQRALSNFKSRETRIYVHRIGRTGRAGLSGISFSFCEAEETGDLRDIQKLIGKNIPVQENHPYHTVFNGITKRPAPQGRPQRSFGGNRNGNAGGNRNGNSSSAGSKSRFGGEFSSECACGTFL
jgi:ATP-dependent RNA helicase RhlE